MKRRMTETYKKMVLASVLDSVQRKLEEGIGARKAHVFSRQLLLKTLKEQHREREFKTRFITKALQQLEAENAIVHTTSASWRVMDQSALVKKIKKVGNTKTPLQSPKKRKPVKMSAKSRTKVAKATKREGSKRAGKKAAAKPKAKTVSVRKTLPDAEVQGGTAVVEAPLGNDTLIGAQMEAENSDSSGNTNTTETSD